jgi:apolipoprotein N-acyltransferase
MMMSVSIARTDRHMVFVLKYWAGFLWFVFAVLMAGRDLVVFPPRIPLVLAFGVAGLFSLTAVEVRAKEDGLWYRRLLRWKRIPYEAISECRLCVWAAYGSLKLNRFMGPWGRLYFVAASPDPTTHPRALIQAINARRGV